MSSIRKTIAALYSTQSKESLFSASSHTSPQVLFQHGVFFGIINTVMENEALTIEATAALLNRIGVQYMATLGLDGKPKVRSVQYMPMRDGKLRFLPIRHKRCMPSCTSLRTSLVYSHARRRRNRFGADPLQCGNGVRRKSRDKKIMQKSAIVQKLSGNDPAHPLFKVFYLKNINGGMNNFGCIKGLPDRNDFAAPAKFSL